MESALGSPRSSQFFGIFGRSRHQIVSSGPSRFSLCYSTSVPHLSWWCLTPHRWTSTDKRSWLFHQIISSPKWLMLISNFRQFMKPSLITHQFASLNLWSQIRFCLHDLVHHQSPSNRVLLIASMCSLTLEPWILHSSVSSYHHVTRNLRLDTLIVILS